MNTLLYVRITRNMGEIDDSGKLAISVLVNNHEKT